MLSGGIDHPRCFAVRFQRTLKFIVQPHRLLRQGFQVREIFADPAPIFQESAVQTGTGCLADQLKPPFLPGPPHIGWLAAFGSFR